MKALCWRLFFAYTGITALGLALLTGAFALVLHREMEEQRRADVAYLVDLSRQVAFPSSESRPLQAHLLRAEVGRAILMGPEALAAIIDNVEPVEIQLYGGIVRRIGKELPVIPPADPAPAPEITVREFTAAAQTLTMDQRTRLFSLARSVTICPKVTRNTGVHCVVLTPLEPRPPVDRLVVSLLPPGPLDELRAAALPWLWPVGLLLLTLVSLISWHQAQRIAVPLGELIRVAQRVASCDLTQRVPGTGPGEVGEAVAWFNRALDSLSAAKEQHQESEQGRRELLASVSHEFRSPLASLRGYLELLQSQVIPPADQPRYLSVMLADTLRLNRLLEDLFEFSRIRAHQVTLHPVPTDPLEACQTVVMALLWRAHRNQVELALDLPESSPLVMADPDRLDQVLTNLVENALRYAGQGGWVRLAVTAQGDAVRFAVLDSGPGIPLEEQGRVWQRFYKVERARTRGEGGGGLGLAIVKELVELMGGRVGLESEVGRGSTFWFILPVATAPE